MKLLMISMRSILVAWLSLFSLIDGVLAENNLGVEAAASAQVEPIIETIKFLASIESDSNNAKGLAQLATVLDARLQDLGFTTRRETSPVDVNADTNVAVKKGTGTQNVMLMAHMDTVFEVGTLDEMPIRVEDGKLYGPGVVDNKGGIAVILHSMQILRELGWTDYDTLTVLFNPDEEIGSSGSGALISKLAADKDTVLSFEVGGSEARGMAWILAGTAAYAQVTMTVKGLASHAGADPDKGRNAIMELSHQVLSTGSVSENIKGAQLNWTNFVSNKAYNQIPDIAVATGDARITVDGAEKELLEALRAKVSESKLVPDTETTISLEILRPGFKANSKGFKVAGLAQKIYGEVTRRNIFIVPMIMGATDAGYAAVSDNVVVLEGFGPSGAGYHSQSEYVDTGSLMFAMYQVTRLLIELGARSSK
jgi:glutamate carboxypeptidase